MTSPPMCHHDISLFKGSLYHFRKEGIGIFPTMWNKSQPQFHPRKKSQLKISQAFLSSPKFATEKRREITEPAFQQSMTSSHLTDREGDQGQWGQEAVTSLLHTLRTDRVPHGAGKVSLASVGPINLCENLSEPEKPMTFQLAVNITAAIHHELSSWRLCNR